MRRTALLAAAAVVTASLASPAYAAPEPYGTLCGFVTASDPQVEGSHSGVVFAGPLVLADDTDLSTYSGSITCTVQVNAPTHADSDSCAVSGPETPVAATAFGTCTYSTSPHIDDIYMCTMASVGGQTLYYDDPNNPANGDVRQGNWTIDPNASCGRANKAGAACGPADWPCNGLLLIVCPLLAIMFPPHGDVGGIDCPPYASTDPRVATYAVYLLPGYHLPRRI